MTRDRSSEIIGNDGSNATVGRPVEQPGQVTGDETAQRVADEPAVLGQPVVRIRTRVEDVIDDHRQDRHVVLPHRLGQGDIDRGVLQRRQPAREHGLRERADQVATPGCDGRGPLLIRQATGPVAFIERVQASVEAVPEHDRASADGVGDRSVLALRSPGTYTRRPNGSDRV